MSRNHTRVLTDQQIQSITQQVSIALQDDTETFADLLVNHYLINDKEGLWDIIVETIEAAEDGKLLSVDQINSVLKEDSYDNL